MLGTVGVYQHPSMQSVAAEDHWWGRHGHAHLCVAKPAAHSSCPDSTAFGNGAFTPAFLIRSHNMDTVR